MANVKKLGTTKILTGATAYCIVRREVDGYLLDDADGLSFAAAPADPFLSLTEDGTIKGLYEVSESRAAWDQGWYKVFFYTQAGGSPVPASDTLDDLTDLFVAGDLIFLSDFPYEYGAVATSVANTAQTFATTLTSAVSDYCVGQYVKFVSGNLINQIRRITTYNGTLKTVTVSSTFTETPADDDEFILVNQ